MCNEYLSLSIVTFNNEDKIEKVINNLTKVLSNNIHYKLYIIDNGSTDETRKIVRKNERKNECITLINENRNLGFGTAHNGVIKLLKSKYHIVINPDVHVDSFEEIEKMIKYLEKNKNVGLLSPLILNENGTIQKLYKQSPTVFDLFIRFISPNFFPKRQAKFVRIASGYNKIGHIDYASGCFMMFRTNVFKQISGFDERYFMYMEDADITCKVNEVSEAIFFPKGVITHQWQRQSHKQVKYVLYSIESMFKFFNKWGWKLW